MKYEELKPEIIFDMFRKISEIPRGSGNESAVGEFVMKTACDHGHSAVRDGSGNVFVRANATPGYEDHEPIALQGHLDMVCEANASVGHDFLRDPIKLMLNGDLLTADGTTLGADDGCAVAIMLSILSSDDIPHPQLECLFTTEEETGMGGMRGFNPGWLRSKRLLNLDSAGEFEATAACAGGVRSHIFFPLNGMTELKDGYSVFLVSLGGLFGGHSGEDINLGRKGAVATLARILYCAAKQCDLEIASYEGGSRDNAIPRECSAVAAVPCEQAECFIHAIRAEEEKIREELVADDCGMMLDTVATDPDGKLFLGTADSKKFISLLRTVPNGVHSMSRDVDGLVETSSNLAVVRRVGDEAEIVVSSRSSRGSQLDDLQNRLECAAQLAGCRITHTDRYPGWDFTKDSGMQKLYLDAVKRMFGVDAKIIGIHAGLECGLLKDKKPDMDMISIGPDIKNLHSPDEVMSVSSFARLYELVKLILSLA